MPSTPTSEHFECLADLKDTDALLCDFTFEIEPTQVARYSSSDLIRGHNY